MIAILLIILIGLWFLGYIHFPFFPIPDAVLFSINNHPITLWNLLIFLVVAWIVGILPRPFREIAGALLILWILSVLGVIAIAALSNLLILAIIIGLVFFLLGGF